ncbi:MAG: F0F1 ATP synthase subunit B [Bacteroidales bacterium]|nr:F0F1 ATP synthase subunit B [Bacteroidales bacterium]
MNLVTPDTGLLFWMVVIFGVVFFLLAKFGFPVITDMVEKRSAKIAQSLRDADEIQARMASWKVEQAQMLEATRKEQSQMLREATETKARIVADAKAQAQAEADKILADAKLQIEAEKESALRDVRREVALLSVQVAEKVLRHELSDEGSQRAFIDQLVDEANQAQMHNHS